LSSLISLFFLSQSRVISSSFVFSVLT